MDTAIGVVCHRHATPIFYTFHRKPVDVYKRQTDQGELLVALSSPTYEEILPEFLFPVIDEGLLRKDSYNGITYVNFGFERIGCLLYTSKLITTKNASLLTLSPRLTGRYVASVSYTHLYDISIVVYPNMLYHPQEIDCEIEEMPRESSEP